MLPPFKSFSIRLKAHQLAFHSTFSFVHRSVANDRYSLWKLGITNVLNAAHGRMYCQGSHDFYGSTVDYYGVPADDSPSFDLSPYFFPSAEYIQNALDTAGGKYASCSINYSFLHVRLQASRHVIHLIWNKTPVSPYAEFLSRPFSSSTARVFVHCAVGVSRSASLVLAYLMIHHRYTLLEAINKVKERRWIFPNKGFLKQLRALDLKLHKRG